jgi:hypothetical protein
MSNHPRRLWVLVLILTALTALAVLSQGQPDGFNGTIYRLGNDHVEVIQPVDASGINLTIETKAENMTLLDKEGKRVGLNSTYLFWRGSHIYGITFERQVAGDLIYFMPRQGQQFILPLNDGGQVRMILPPGYTTGDRILGIARPTPDEFQADDAGNVLTWRNTSGYQFIEVNYYRDSAPQALMKIFGILVGAALILLAEHYASIRRLRAVREDAEKSADSSR